MSGVQASGNLIKGAVWYADFGWSVFPTWGIVNGLCGCGRSHPEPKDQGKHPHGRLVPDGHTSATCDPGVVESWWVADPEANVAVSCEASGLIVIDIDPRNGGLDSLPRLMDMLAAEGLEDGLPQTVEAMTGAYAVRGGVERGRHLFFKVGPGESFRGKFEGLRGIDIKHKGYVLISPSRHASGEVYEWVKDHEPWRMPVSDAPEQLLGLIRKRRPRGSAGGSGGGGGEYGVVEWGGEKIDVDAILEAGIEEGERVNVLYPMACALANKYPVSEAFGVSSLKSLMRGINARHVTPPLPEDELDFQVDRAIEFVLDNPITEKLWPGIEEYSSAMEVWTGTGGREVVSRVTGEITPALGVPAAVEPVEEALSVGGGGEIPAGMLPRDVDSLNVARGGEIGNRTLSDLGNGRRLVDYAGAKLRYSVGMGWFVWNSEYWVPDSGRKHVDETAKDLPVWIAREISLTADADRAEALLKWANRAKAAPMRKTAIEDASSDTRVLTPISRWDADPYLLGVKNGVIDLRTGALTPSADSREKYITKQVEVAYSPGMTNVRWKEFLTFVTGGDGELERYLQLAAGYTLTGLRHHECLFLVYGPAGSGKSTFLDVLGTLLGSYKQNLEASVLADTGYGPKGSQEYYMAQLMGKRMIAISELPEMINIQEDAIKRLTGDATIVGRNPGGQPFEFSTQGKLWIGTNHRPIIRDNAMWRRIRAIPFNHVPEKPDPDLKDYLQNPNGALPAALAWCVEGAMMLLGSGERQPLRASASAVVFEATKEYQASENRLAIFVDEETVPNAGASVMLSNVYETYKGWSEDRGEKWMSFAAFRRKLLEAGYVLTGEGGLSTMVLHDRVMTPRAVPTVTAPVDWTAAVSRSRHPTR